MHSSDQGKSSFFKFFVALFVFISPGLDLSWHTSLASMDVVMEYLDMVVFFLLVSWITIEFVRAFSEGRRVGEGSAQPCAIDIVGPQFCTPRPIVLIFNAQAPNSDLEVKVRDGNDVFKAVRSSRSPKNSFRREILLSFNDSLVNDSLVVSMQKKKFTAHSGWQVFKVDRSGKEYELLFTVKKASALYCRSRTELEVFLARNRREECDFKIMGSYDNRGWAVHQANPSIMVAQMNANMLQEEHHLFEMHVNPNIDYCFIVALTVILYEKYHKKGNYNAVIKIAKIVKGVFECAGAATGFFAVAISIISNLCGS